MLEPHAVKLLTLNEAAERLRKTPAQLRWMLYANTAPRSGLIGGASDVPRVRHRRIHQQGV